MAAAPSPSSPRLPGGPALGARPLLPGPGSGVRSSLQATQFRTSRSKHWAWTHRVGAGASLPLGLLGPRLMLLRPLHPRLGLSRLLCPTGRKPGGATAHCPRPRPPARWGGTLPRGPRALCLRPSLSTCGFSLQPSLPPLPRAPSQPLGGPWAREQCWGSAQGLLLDSRGWAPQSAHRPLGALLCPSPQGQRIAPGDPH